jgi:hypothetical protein
MPKVPAERLREIGKALLMANKVPEGEASTVARHVVNANLAGHDSHGVIMLPNYIDRVRANQIVPGAPFTIVQESPTTTVVDGNWGFGYVINEKAMQLTIEKAEKSNIAACTVFRQGHVGRLASYPDGGACRHDRHGLGGFRALAEGRGALRRPRGAARHQSLGDGSALGSRRGLLHGHGHLGRGDGQDQARRGARAGGPARLDRGQRGRSHHRPREDQGRRAAAAGRAGRGLQGDCARRDGRGVLRHPDRPRLRRGAVTGRHNDGCFLIAIKVDAFRPLLTFRKDVADFANYLKDTPPAKGSSGVLYPGEVEHRQEQKRGAEGIEIEDATWKKLGALAQEGGIAGTLGFA